MVLDAQAAEMFRCSKLDWDEWIRPPHQTLIAWYCQLLRLRQEHPALRDHRLEGVRVTLDEEARWLVLRRGPLAVVRNLADEAQPVPFNGADVFQLRLSSRENDDVALERDGLILPGPGVVILEAV